MQDTNQVHDFFDYKIPEAIKTKIPDGFYQALRAKLIGIFGQDVFDVDVDSGICNIEYVGGTGGYVEAFEAACRELNVEWISKYYDGLEWYESDLFDGEIIDEMMKHILGGQRQ